MRERADTSCPVCKGPTTHMRMTSGRHARWCDRCNLWSNVHGTPLWEEEEGPFPFRSLRGALAYAAYRSARAAGMPSTSLFQEQVSGGPGSTRAETLGQAASVLAKLSGDRKEREAQLRWAVLRERSDFGKELAELLGESSAQRAGTRLSVLLRVTEQRLIERRIIPPKQGQRARRADVTTTRKKVEGKAAIADVLGVSSSTLDAMRADGRVPAGIVWTWAGRLVAYEDELLSLRERDRDAAKGVA